MADHDAGAGVNLEQSYRHLLTLWTSGVRGYHTMLSGCLTTDRILVSVIGLLV